MDLTGNSIVAGRDVPGGGEAWRGTVAATGGPRGPLLRDASPETVAEAARQAAGAARAYEEDEQNIALCALDAFLDWLDDLFDAASGAS
ncbi:aldehyde dehydrogenase (NADP(+)), partial [Streptomyces fradiae]